MDRHTTATLLETAAKSLLSNELAAIHALGEIPRDLFVPLFNAAFLGGHKKILKAIVGVWPFRCLHIGRLNAQRNTMTTWKPWSMVCRSFLPRSPLLGKTVNTGDIVSAQEGTVC